MSLRRESRDNESASAAGGLSGGLGGIAAPALDGYLLSLSVHPLPIFLNGCLFAVVSLRRRDYWTAGRARRALADQSAA